MLSYIVLIRSSRERVVHRHDLPPSENPEMGAGWEPSGMPHCLWSRRWVPYKQSLQRWYYMILPTNNTGSAKHQPFRQETTGGLTKVHCSAGTHLCGLSSWSDGRPPLTVLSGATGPAGGAPPKALGDFPIENGQKLRCQICLKLGGTTIAMPGWWWL